METSVETWDLVVLETWDLVVQATWETIRQQVWDPVVVEVVATWDLEDKAQGDLLI